VHDVDLRHPRDEYSHAITRHAPNINMAGKSEFDSHGEMHIVRKLWLEKHTKQLNQHKEDSFFGDLVYNGKTYRFGLEYKDGKWHEITGYPKK